MTHHSCIGWVQVGSAWTLRVLHFSVRQKLVRCSCICHSLEVHLYILPLILNILWCELSYDFPFYIGFLLSRAKPYLIVGFPLFSPFFTPSIILLSLLPCHSTIPTVVLFNLCLLGLFWAYCMLFSQWSSMVIGSILMLPWAFLIHYIACGLLVPFLSQWTSLSHLLSLGILSPFSNSTFPWVFTNSFGLPWPNYRILHPWGSWTFHQPLTFLLHYFRPIVAPFLLFYIT